MIAVLTAAAKVVADHRREDGYAGNGYTEPREAWISCSCGAHVWNWQQFYFETSEDPNQCWLDHVAAMAAAAVITDGMRHWTRTQQELCVLPMQEEDWGPW